MLSVRLLGQFDVRYDGEPVEIASRAAQSLLAYLILNAGKSHRREKLAGMFWPDEDETTARKRLRQALWQLRAALGEEHFEADRITVQFKAEADCCLDVEPLQGPVRGGDPADELLPVAEAYGGELLPGFYEEWVLQERENLRLAYEQKMTMLLDRLQAEGRWEEMVEAATTWLSHDGTAEPAYRALIAAYAAQGDMAGVTAAYERCVSALREELGVPPTDETRHLYERVTGAGPGPRPLRNPYRGLYSFQEEDAPYFFGRESFIAGLVEAVRHKPLLTLIGPSGIGKTSVMFAGVLPRLRALGGWQIASLRPGADPFHSLAAALAPLLPSQRQDPSEPETVRQLAAWLETDEGALAQTVDRVVEGRAGERLLLVVDQFEELFAHFPETEDRHRLLDALLETVAAQRLAPHPSLTVLITLRADFIGQALTHRPFADAQQDAGAFLGPMTPEELSRAIRAPAKMEGVNFESGLVERILDDLGGAPGQLPLLEFTLTQLWERQKNALLTHEAYEAIGKLEGALARYADEVYAALAPSEQEGARRLFVQLVQPGRQAADTRRQAQRAQLGDDIWQIARKLADARLVVTGRDAAGEEVVEVAHEALIGNWDRLQAWMEADRAFRAWQERLRVSVTQWQVSQQDEGALLRGLPLSEASRWLDERADDLSEDERRYIRASINLASRRQAERESARRRTMTGLALGLVVALILMAIAGLSWFQSQRNERAALEAYSVSLAANAQEALNDLDTATALVLAQAANDMEDPPRLSQRTLLEAAYAPGPRARYDAAAMAGLPGGEVTDVALSPVGKTALVAFSEGTVVELDLESGEIIHELKGHSPEEEFGSVDWFKTVVAYHPSGTLALSGSADGEVILWDVQAGREVRRFGGHSGWVQIVAFSPDGRQALSGGFEGTFLEGPGELILWDVETGREIRRFEGHGSGVVAAAFTPDGQGLLAGSGVLEYVDVDVTEFERTLILWDVAQGEMAWKVDLGPEGTALDATQVAVSPDGATALTSASDGNVSVWDMANGNLQQTLSGPRDVLYEVAITPDGRRAVTGGIGTLIQWDLQSGEPVSSLRVHDRAVQGAAITPDGRRAVTGSLDGTVIVWDLRDAAEIRRFADRNAPLVMDVAFTPDGRGFLSAPGHWDSSIPVPDSEIRLWDLESGRQIRAFKGHTDTIFSIDVSADGQTLLSGSEDHTARVWDLETGTELLQSTEHKNWISEVAIAPDGHTALTGSVDGDLLAWDLETGAIRHAFPVVDVWGMDISPDGHLAVSGGNDNVATLWDLDRGRRLRDLAVEGVGGLAFHPGGKTVVGGSFSYDLVEWDVETGREMRRLEGHDDLNIRITFNPEGTRALSSDLGGTLILWDWPEGIPLRRIHQPGITSETVVSPDGRSALSAVNNTVIHWDLNVPTLEELSDWIAENRYVRELTCQERELYRVEPLCEEG